MSNCLTSNRVARTASVGGGEAGEGPTIRHLG